MTTSTTCAVNSLQFHTTNKSQLLRKAIMLAAAVVCLLMMSVLASAQLTGTKNIPGNYADLAAAITDLNTQGVGAGGVTFNLIAGNPQTAPAGGYVIGNTGSLVLTTSSAANPIVFNGNGNTITAPTPQAAGNLNDGIFKLIGADWVTLNGFSMSENAANTTTAAATNNMTEWGVALLYVTATDGAQNDTITNCTIDLDRTYQNTFGIYSNSTHTATAVTTSASATGAAGSNDNLKVYSNNITDVNNGIVVVGPTAAADQNNNLDIGGVALATANTITNFGTTGTFSGYANVSGTVNGILVRNTRNFNVSFNTVTSSNGGVTVGTLNGIQIPASSNAPTGTLTQTINNNSLSLRAGAVGSAMNGINMPSGSVNTTTTVSINNNDFNTFGHTVAGATAAITFITQASVPLASNMNGNTFTNISVNTTGAVTFFAAAPILPSGSSLSISSNQIVTGFTRTGVGATTVWNTNSTSVNGSSHAANNNNFSNVTLTGASAFTGISDTDGASGVSGPVKSVNGNTFNNINTGAGTVTPMSVNFSGANSTVSNNTISNITTSNSITCLTLGTSNQATLTVAGNLIDPITSGGTSVTAISAGAPTAVYSKNKIYDVSGTVAGSAVSGILVVNTTANSNVTLSNNLVGNLTAPAATGGNAIVGIGTTGTATTSTFNIFYNTVFVNNTTSGAGFGSSGIFILASATATTSAVNLRNNIVVNTSVQNGAGLTVAYRRSAGTAGTLANYASTSNNNLFYAGTPSATNLIYADNVSTAQTIAAYRNGVFTAGTIAPRDSVSVSENPPFLSTTGSSANFLHINPGTPTQAESGGSPIGGITDDFDGNARNGSTPDIGADEFAGIVLDLTPPVITYTPLGNTASTANRTLSVTITDLSGVAGGATAPRVYYRKNGGSYFSNQCSAPTGSLYPCTIDYTLVGGVVTTDVIDYFVVAQDNAGNLAANPSAGFSGSNVNSITTPPTTPNTYTIVTAFPATANVGTAQTYTSLTGAGGLFAAINAAVLNQNVTVNITSDLTEDGTNALNQWSEDGAGGYTVTIVSSGTLKTISGPVANGMIRLNGADRTTFDGRVGGTGQFLLFRNTNTTNPTFTFQNDATNNTIESCLVESGNTTLASGTILFSTSTGTLGNSGNTIHLSDIRDRSDAAGVPANGVFSSGSASAPNGTNTVSGCNVFNFTNAGVLVTATGAGNGWIVNPSSFYQTAARTTAATGISIQGGSGHSVLNNSIGGTAPNAGGANWATSQTFRGIDLTVGTAAATSVQGNVIKNIRSTYPAADFASSYGIFLEAGLANIGNITGNQVGSSNAAERYEISGDSYGIRVVSTSTVNVSNNTVNNFGTAATPPTGEFYFGMSVEGTGGAHTVVNNTVSNVTNASVPDASFSTQTIGMIVSATGVQTIRGNTVSNINSTSVTAPTANNNRVWGLLVSATAVGTVVDRNKIDNIFAASAGVGARSDVITCVQSQTVANATFTNNMVSTSAGAASDRAIFGILDLSAAPAISNYYFNSVNITGTATAANNTYAFNRNSTPTITLRNNIFADSRSGGTGFHVAMANTNAAATGWSATASDRNLLFNATAANLTQWLGAAAGNNQTLAGFQAASGGDANTTSADPLFVSATDLHITPASPAVANGVTFGGVTNDFDNDPRPASNPDKGADEIVQAVGGVLAAGTYYNASGGTGDTLGGNVTVTNTFYLTGMFSTGANTLTIDCNGTVSGASPTSFVIGNLQKNYCATGVKGFEVGTANGYSPVSVNVTAGTFPANFTVKATQGPQPNVNAATSLQRYWTLTEGGSLTANVNFNYLDPTDIAGTESDYHIIRVSSGTPVAFPNNCPVPGATQACVDFAGNQATINGVTNFSDWTLGTVAAPTAAPAFISGQVTSPSGAPLGGVTMYLNGARSARTITDAQGNYRFENIDTENLYTVTPSILNYHFSPENRVYNLLTNVSNASFTGAMNSVSSGNVIDTPEFFVRQHYLDFLGREPDQAGLIFWSDQLLECGNDFNCLERRTINVSAAYFRSIEFQKTGGLVHGLYEVSYGRAPHYAEFMPDAATIGREVIVNNAGWEARLRANTDEFLADWVQRPSFKAAYDNLTNDSYVDALIGNTGVTFTDTQRNALVSGLTDGSLTRAQVLERVAENGQFMDTKRNEMFVRMEYFGYLRRDPDEAGFHFWLDKLNQFDGNFERAEMVKSFLVSGEYRDRFRPQQ
ncbi:MAG TPA: DUF4214 domain-containing protein [Pyrinomonadaceae bacterium]|nr:DUF4214 domain-containing protein [Pyrinomonadaceae bacterium]